MQVRAFDQSTVLMFEHQGTESHLHDTWMNYAVPLSGVIRQLLTIGTQLPSKWQFSPAPFSNFKEQKPPLHISNSCQPSAPFFFFLHTRPSNSWHNYVCVIKLGLGAEGAEWGSMWLKFSFGFDRGNAKCCTNQMPMFWIKMNSAIHVHICTPHS